MRIAVFGAGYAGLALARRLERTAPPDAELVVVDESGRHVVRHLLHRAIRRPDVLESLTFPLGTLLDRASIREREVVALDADGKTATFANGETMAFDVGAVCFGSEPAFYGLDGIETHARTLHRSPDPQRIRDGFLDVLADDGRVVVGGGGLTGVQVAGELAALAEERDEGGADIVLVEQAENVPPGYDDRLQQAVTDALRATGVTVRTGVTVTGADGNAVAVENDDSIAYDQLLWAGGIDGPEAIGGDRSTVRATLRLQGDVFALGDAAQVIDADGRAVPATAQAAIRQAPVAATNVRRRLEYRRSGEGFEPRLERYRYSNAGLAISIGDDAVAKVGPSVLTGGAAEGVKTAIGAGYLSDIGAVRDAVEHVRDALAT